MKAKAVVFEEPQKMHIRDVNLSPMGSADLVVAMEYTGISTGTEKMIWNGKMPHFPGMGYPLVPGYESIGKVIQAGAQTTLALGQSVFVPGANCYGEVKGLFGGASSHVVVPESRVTALGDDMGAQGILLALAATAFHVTGGRAELQPDLIIGHGILGRLLARIAVAKGKTPVVWENNSQRQAGAEDYLVMSAEDDDRQDYACIVDASGDVSLINSLISKMRKQGELVLAGFYDKDVSFMFAPAFMREIRLRIAAQWQPNDLLEVQQLIHNKKLSLSGLISHTSHPQDAHAAYETAFNDAQCLKMIIDWRQ